MGDVIEISPSPEPRTRYRPLRRKRDPDGNESVIELSDSTDSQSSTPCKRVKRRKEAAESGAGPSTSSNVLVVRSRASSPRVIVRTHKSGVHPTSPRTSAVPQRASPPVQEPLLGQELGVQSRPLTPLATIGTPQPATHPHSPLPHESPPPVSTPASEVAPEPYERLVQRVREVVPDVLPTHVFELLAAHEAVPHYELLNVVIHILLEDRSYPKDIKGKGKARAAEGRSAEISGDTNTSVDYTHLDASRHLGRVYQELSLKSLRGNFPDLDLSFILEILSLHEGHYAPTYLYLLQHGATPTSVLPVAPRLGKRKGKAGSKPALDEEEFLKEHTWLVQKLENRQGSPVPELTPEHLREGEGIECGCCFTTYPFGEMAQCTDTHLFCTSCVTSYASTKLGEQDSDLRCMDISGCKMAFPDSELRRVLPGKLLELYEHIRQRRDIELAELEGLEECPFCDYKVVMDVDFQTDKVLRCQNEECRKVSCRKCKKEDHLPKSCEEMEEDKKLDGKHAIEEAMTRALMRNCPKCQKAFVKEYGCNKMTCTYCRTVSCYVCRSIIRDYNHFEQTRPAGAQQPSRSSRCPLWERVEDRHAMEVTAAANKALEEYKTLHPDVLDEDIRVELPPPPPPPPPPPDMRMLQYPGGAPRFPPPPAYVQVHHAHNAHVPVAHPVVALPNPALPAQQFNHEYLFAPGPPVLGGLGQHLPPRQDAPVMYPMPPPQPYNPLQARPAPYNLRAHPPVPHNLRAHLPVPYNLRAHPPAAIRPLPRAPLHHMAPPIQVAGAGRMSGRGKRRR